MDRTIAFVGIGLMGFPMTRRLVEHAQHADPTLRVLAWNRDPTKAARLAEHGVIHAESLAHVAAEADVIALSLADTAAVEQVVASLAPSLRPGQLVVDFSSIEPGATRRLAESLRALGVGWVDAPVSGGVVGAENGTLAIMAGGAEADVARARALAVPLGQRFTHVGPVGAGQVAKVCNQMIVACNAVVLAEVVALAEAAGVDAAMLPVALRGGFADSIPFQLLVPRMAARRFEPVQWRVRTLLKDLDTAVSVAGAAGANVPMSRAAAELFRRHASGRSSIGDTQAAEDNGARDPSTLIELYAPSDEAP